MIRAHLATFPPRKAIMLEAVARISPQVDRVFVALNEYTEVPVELAGFPNVEPVIPEADLKDTGKFYFPPAPDDVVFTIDDDITFPRDYVKTTLKHAKQINLNENAIGYQAHAWVFKKQEGRFGWRNHMFFKKVNRPFSVDILGTGTACVLGKNMPPFEYMKTSQCYADVRFATWLQEKGLGMWTLPRQAEYLGKNLPDALEGGSIFNTFTRKRTPEASAAIHHLLLCRTGEAGKPWK